MLDQDREPSVATKPDGATIAYHRTPGKNPGVVFLGGFKSDMTGTKALALEAYCKKQGRAFLRFDYQGHGQSSGSFEEGSIGTWANDATFAISTLTKDPQVLVGSSMGGWIMLLVAKADPQKCAALVGIAAAPDFTEDLIAAEFTADDHTMLDNQGYVDVPSDYDDTEPYRITKTLIKDGRHHLLLRQPLEIEMPIRLLQGMQDKDVPYETAIQTADVITGTDITIQLIKDGDHRLSRDQDLNQLFATLDGVFDAMGN